MGESIAPPHKEHVATSGDIPVATLSDDCSRHLVGTSREYPLTSSSAQGCPATKNDRVQPVPSADVKKPSHNDFQFFNCRNQIGPFPRD